MINTQCHGCKLPMELEAQPVVLGEMDGTRKTHYGKASSVWICKTCRLDPFKLRAARVAAGMPANPTWEGFDADAKN